MFTRKSATIRAFAATVLASRDKFWSAFAIHHPHPHTTSEFAPHHRVRGAFTNRLHHAIELSRRKRLRRLASLFSTRQIRLEKIRLPAPRSEERRVGKECR